MSRVAVAQGVFTLVERCGCGAMYLSIGPVCMKLDPSALGDLRDTLARAVRAFAPEGEADGDGTGGPRPD